MSHMDGTNDRLFQRGRFAPTKELLGEIIRDTDKAIQFQFLDDEDVEHTSWFPRSQIKEIHHEDPARIVVTEWIYNTKEAAGWK